VITKNKTKDSTLLESLLLKLNLKYEEAIELGLNKVVRIRVYKEDGNN
jgi:hypothetical protein